MLNRFWAARALSQLSFLLLFSSFSFHVLGQSKVGAPYFDISNDSAGGSLPLLYQKAEVDIAGIFAKVELCQAYTNRGTAPIEAVYVFPASTEAAVAGLEIRIGERRIQAEIRTWADADSLYN
ncbi:MAG: VIT domain-containing protein, partial [Bacteroidota bacterium]